METAPLILEAGPAFLAPATETREKLLAAAARASRLLLEATDAMKAMPDVLRLLGEAADVHRTALALAEVDAGGERWLVIKDEWISEELMDSCAGDSCSCSSRASTNRSMGLRAHPAVLTTGTSGRDGFTYAQCSSTVAAAATGVPAVAVAPGIAAP